MEKTGQSHTKSQEKNLVRVRVPKLKVQQPSFRDIKGKQNKSIIHNLIITNKNSSVSGHLQHETSSHVSERKPIKLKSEDCITISKVQAHDSHYGHRL